MDALFKDLRSGIRTLLKNPGFTAIAVITLAFGIGANCAMFSLVNAMLIQSLPFREPDRLMWVWDVRPQLEQAPASYPEYVDWRSMNQVFERPAAGHGSSFNLPGTGDPERFPGSNVTSNSFEMAPGVRARSQVSGVGCQNVGTRDFRTLAADVRRRKSEVRKQKSKGASQKGDESKTILLFLAPRPLTPGTRHLFS